MTRPTVQFTDDKRSPSQWLEAANELAREYVQTDAITAYTRVREGDYEGTPFAAELRSLMFLAGEDKPLPRAAE